jgi:large subunit ribosomal protein L4
MELLIQDTQAHLEVDDLVFGMPYREDLIHQAVVTVMNHERSGNSAQKTRAEVRGGGKKPWNQKGTGRARAGTIRSPLWRSGGVIFAAKKRDYSQKINKKMYKGAIRSIIAELYRSGRMTVVSEFSCETPKTKDFKAKMQAMNLNNALIVMHEISEMEYLGSRNLSEYAIYDTLSLDPYILLRYEHVVMTVDAVKMLEEKLQ